jgi:hypothetical protein
MPDAWFPQAIRDPGRQANYRSGRCAALIDVAHETVGRDSLALIRDQGLAWMLGPKVGPPIQFCPCDATTAHACEFNTTGAGYELERFPGEPPTADQTYWMGAVLRWRYEQWGVPLAHHAKERGRLPIGTGFRGTADHGGLTHHKCDQHTDGWPDPEYANALAAAGGGPIQTQEDNMPGELRSNRGTMYLVVPSQATATALTPDSLKYLVDEDAAYRAFGQTPILYGPNAAPISDGALAGLTKIPVGFTFANAVGGGGTPAIDYAAIAKAVNDETAARLKG